MHMCVAKYLYMKILYTLHCTKFIVQKVNFLKFFMVIIMFKDCHKLYKSMHIMLVCGRELFKDNGFKFFANFTFSPLKISSSLVMCTARLGYTQARRKVVNSGGAK